MVEDVPGVDLVLEGEDSSGASNLGNAITKVTGIGRSSSWVLVAQLPPYLCLFFFNPFLVPPMLPHLSGHLLFQPHLLPPTPSPTVQTREGPGRSVQLNDTENA